MGPGGAERNVANLLPFLVKRYEVHLILMSKVIAYEIPSEVQIHFIENSDPYESGLKKLARLFLAMPMLAFKYKKLCLNLGIDTQFVLMNRPCYIAGVARILGLKARLVISERSCPSILYKNDLSGRVNKFLLTHLYKKADLILANAAGNKEDLVRNFGMSEDKTKVLYNALDLKTINLLKDEAIVLNLGRGGIVDEAAMARAIDERNLRFGTDVLESEPMSKNSPFLNVKNKENLLITPHVAWGSLEARKRLISLIVKNIEEFIKG